jgi:hypothetical protein
MKITRTNLSYDDRYDLENFIKWRKEMKVTRTNLSDDDRYNLDKEVEEKWNQIRRWQKAREEEELRKESKLAENHYRIEREMYEWGAR